MKRFVAIFFFTVYLLSTHVQVLELMKLPVLMEHFAEHRQRNPQVTFIQFLCMHYTEQNVKDSDYERDMQLPFKTLSHSPMIWVGCIVPSAQITLHTRPVIAPEQKMLFPKEEAWSSQYLSFIWQPPRTVA
ncbi:hypothetical protein [Rurimicrobium arvi]|uniref:hypothetical protein n=1 Tax=Rurimicrobium arvi TaxID=2049916 RepID=UPI0031D03AC3